MTVLFTKQLILFAFFAVVLLLHVPKCYSHLVINLHFQFYTWCGTLSLNCEVRDKTNKMQQLDVYYQYFLNIFWASLCPSSGEQDVYYCTWCAALVLLDVVGSSCGALCCRVRALWSRTVTFTVLAPYNAAPHNRYQPHPSEPAQHTTCSNTCLVLLKMGIMMPETCWESVDNKHLTVASCWL